MRILTTHTGSLPRPLEVEHMLYSQERGEDIDQALFEASVQKAVREVVQQQVVAGLDVVNDGEQSKISYTAYVTRRLSGFEGQGSLARMGAEAPDLRDFPDYALRLFTANQQVLSIKTPACTGPIAYTGGAAVGRDIANLQEALAGMDVTTVFMNAASPGIVGLSFENQYYPSHEAFLFALAEALKAEYDAIVQAGLLLQLDCPDLAVDPRFLSGVLGETPQHYRQMHIEALNYATRTIPPERMRMHVCWGNYEGPHHYDLPLREIIAPVLRARPAALLIEAANPRHAHEWRVFEEIKLPDGKILAPGVIDSTTNFIEHPDLVAERIVRFARLVGRERVIAGVDCGFATMAGLHTVDPQIAWAKLQSLAEGARLASQQMW